MRWLLSAALCALLIAPLSCTGGDSFNNKTQCNDGDDNDGDGATDFPDDIGCDGQSDDSEDSLPSPECKDGRDNDGDGKIDFPTDPGCYAPQQNGEADDCPDGPNCPQCSDGLDNDMNGTTDYPGDSGGCMAASDSDEYTRNLVACGSNVTIKTLPFDGHATGMLANGTASSLTSPMCGGGGSEDVYELRIISPKVVVATTDNDGTDANTVLYIRGSDCVNNSSEMTCSDDLTTTNRRSTVTKSISQAGTYYLVVDARDSASGGAYELTVQYLTGEDEMCSGDADCGPGLVCRVRSGQKVCSKHVCEDTIDDDQDGKNGYPMDPGCSSPVDDDETDTCPSGPNCPECGDGVDNDGDLSTDYGQDTTCKSAGDSSEACVTSEGVTTIVAAATMGTTVGATNDVKVTCAYSLSTAPDKVYRLDLPATSTLTIDNVNSFDAAVALYNSTCGGTVVQCADEPERIVLTNQAAGVYYYVVDGWSTSSGPFTINVTGKIANGGRCENALAVAGALTCNTGYTCKGTAGSKTCQL